MSAGNAGGVKDATLTLSGDAVYSLASSTSPACTGCSACRPPRRQGRIHTSTITVAVMPEAEDVDVQINPADIEMQVMRSTGAGGQSVNTTDSAVRLIHKPVRHRGEVPAGEEPDQEPRDGDADARAPSSTRWSRSASAPSATRCARARWAPATAARRSAPTTSRRTG